MKKFGAQYQLFGIFAVLNYIIPLFLGNAHNNSFITQSIFQIFIGLLCVGLLFAEVLEKKYEKLFPFYWHFTLMLCLPMTSFMMITLNNTKIYWLFNLAISISLLAILVDWISFSIILLIGTVLGYFLIKIFFPLTEFTFYQDDLILEVFMFGCMIYIFALFSRQRDHFIEDKLNNYQILGGSIAHELHTPLASIRAVALGSQESINKLILAYETATTHNLNLPVISNSQLAKLKDSHMILNQVSKEALLLVDMLLKRIGDSPQSSAKNHTSIIHVLHHVLDTYPLSFEQLSKINLNLAHDFYFYGNDTFISHVMYNLFKNSFQAIEETVKGEIFITSSSDIEYNKLSFKDTASGIKPELLPNIFDKFVSTKRFGTGLGLAFCKLVMEEMGGSISCHSVFGEYTEFTLYFPKC